MSHAVHHPSTVALVSLAAHVAALHPDLGLAHSERLRSYGVSEEQIDLVVDIARRVREEAALKLDAAFDVAFAAPPAKP
jgi:hypothetical protein